MSTSIFANMPPAQRVIMFKLPSAAELFGSKFAAASTAKGDEWGVLGQGHVEPVPRLEADSRCLGHFAGALVRGARQ